MLGKQNLASALGLQKDFGSNHAVKIIKHEFGKERHPLLCILKLFTNIVD